jgi:hypothetical protein
LRRRRSGGRFDIIKVATLLLKIGTFCRPTFPDLVPPWGIQRQSDGAYCFMPGVEHQSRLMPAALAP